MLRGWIAPCDRPQFVEAVHEPLGRNQECRLVPALTGVAVLADRVECGRQQAVPVSRLCAEVGAKQVGPLLGPLVLLLFLDILTYACFIESHGADAIAASPEAPA